MSVIVNLTTETKIENCSVISINDITGNYDSVNNPFGYGVPGGIDYVDIAQKHIKLYYPNISTPIQYNILMTGGNVTDIRVLDLNGISYNANPFLGQIMTGRYLILNSPLLDGLSDSLGTSFFKNPKLSDGIIKTEYNVTGTEPFNPFNNFDLTTSNAILSYCELNNCILDLYNKMDLCCGCSIDKLEKITQSETFLLLAQMAIELNKQDEAYCFLKKAKDLCTNCTDC